MLLLPDYVLKKGLEFVAPHLKPQEQSQELFHEHYGSDPLDIASLWFDLQHHDDEKGKPLLDEKEDSENGFYHFMKAMFFLWAYPKNAGLLRTRFRCCEKYSRGVDVWDWVKKIAALKKQKIVWEKNNSLVPIGHPVFKVTIDGVDFKTREKGTVNRRQDNKKCSMKFKSCGKKYMIAMSICNSRCVFLSKDYDGAVQDKEMFLDCGLKDLLLPNEMIIADRGFLFDEKKHPELVTMFATPNLGVDSKELNNFKSRARCRHETFNGRIKNFSILQDKYHHAYDNHHFAVEAVCVIVQYQMENGAELFAV